MEKLKVSVCITIFKEKTEIINSLLDSLKNQTLKPDEIIIIDAKDYNNCSRSEGRNISIRKAKNEVIAVTDAGCIPNIDWLEEITKPFLNTKDKIEVVAGVYEMKSRNDFEKAESIYLGISKSKIDDNFLPSARSMAFTKKIWKKVGGFPESLSNTAEDTLFNLNLIKIGAQFKVAKKAIVEWSMPIDLNEFAGKVYNYAKGDAQSGIWWHPIKKLNTHNLKILTIYLRYAVFLLLGLGFGFNYAAVVYSLYLLYSYIKAGKWAILLQPVSDISIMAGFLRGIINPK